MEVGGVGIRRRLDLREFGAWVFIRPPALEEFGGGLRSMVERICGIISICLGRACKFEESTDWSSSLMSSLILSRKR